MMALGYASSLNDLMVGFDLNKLKSVKDLPSQKKKSLFKQVFIESIKMVLHDILDNNNTFITPNVGRAHGELRMEAITDSEFERARKNGKFRDIDFLESMFTGYQMYLYLYGSQDKIIPKRKKPIYFSKEFRNKLVKNTNEGKQYG